MVNFASRVAVSIRVNLRRKKAGVVTEPDVNIDDEFTSRLNNGRGAPIRERLRETQNR